MLLAENAHLTTRLAGSFGNGHSGNLWGALVTPGGLGQQQDSQCKQPNEKESFDKAVLLERQTKKASVQRSPVCMFTGSAI